jgi:hypothetical protein
MISNRLKTWARQLRTSNAELQSSSLVNPDYEAHKFIDFGAANEYLLPSAPSSDLSLRLLPRQQLFSPRFLRLMYNMQSMHTSQRFSSSRSLFNMLVKPKPLFFYKGLFLKYRLRPEIHLKSLCTIFSVCVRAILCARVKTVRARDLIKVQTAHHRQTSGGHRERF